MFNWHGFCKDLILTIVKICHQCLLCRIHFGNSNLTFKKWQGSVPTPTADIHSTGTMATVGFHLLRIWLISRKPKCYPTEISINQLQCWKGPVFTIKVLQKNTALKIWWDPGLVEIFCRAATRDWDWSSKYMSHLTTFINLPLSLFLPYIFHICNGLK